MQYSLLGARLGVPVRICTLLLSFLLSCSPQGTHARCPHPTPAQKTLPGLDGTLGRGVDLTVFSFPISGRSSGDILSCVVNMTLTSNFSWFDQYTNESVLLWDQVDGVTPTPSFFEDSAGVVVDSMYSFMEWLYASVSESGMFGLFSKSASFSEFFSAGYSNNATLFMVRGVESAYYATLLEPSELQPDAQFLADAMALPVLWETPRAWKSWVAHFGQYGTHYIWRGYFGGNYFYAKFVDALYVSESGEAEMSAEGSLDFLDYLSLDGGASAHAQQASSAYVSAGAAVVSCYGCDELIGYCHNMQNNSAEFAQWVNCASRSPALHNATFMLNSRLLPAGPLRENHVAATTAYIAWSGVEWMLSALSAARNEFQRIGGWPAELNCSCHAPWPGFGPICSRWDDGTEATYDAVRANALTMLNTTLPLIDNITLALEARNRSLIPPPLAVLEDWMSKTLGIIAIAFSGPPQLLQCSSTDLMPAHQGYQAWCDQGCCWVPDCCCCIGHYGIVCFSDVYPPRLLSMTAPTARRAGGG